VTIVKQWTGREIRALREAKRMSQEAFAHRYDFGERTVRMWESTGARARPRPDSQAVLDQALGEATPEECARFEAMLAGSAPVGEAVTLGSATAVGAEPTGDDDIGEVDVSLSRRSLFAAAGMTGVAAVTAAGAPPRFTPTPGVDYLGYFGRKRTSVIEGDNLFGARSVVAEVEQAIDRMAMVRRAGLVDAAPMLRMQIIFAEFAAWLNQDMRRWGPAQGWSDKALRWAHRLSEDYYRTFVLIRQAQIAGDMGDGEEAVDLAHAAEHCAPPHSKLAAAAVAFGAHGHALTGDADRSAREYDRARMLLDSAESDPTWAFWLDHAYIDVHQAQSLAAAEQYARALDLFAAAIPRIPDEYSRDKGAYTAWYALAAERAGDAELAAHAGTHALAIGAATGSGRILADVGELHASIDGTADAVREFRHTYELTAAEA
jgi:tetratricopeptide (TPR) repeat protein/transcriptional regulator with XRE-family HTH domain